MTIHDAFDDHENQTSCIVMEMVPGVTLEKILTSGRPLTTEQTLSIVRQVAEGLDYAHRNQVIHRDLKPANILVTEDGRAKITDFGIAKVLAREGMARTVGVMGTPSYMSPEQVRGGEIDARTDIFSLGIIIFTMLTETKPFAGNTAAVMFKIVYEEPPLPSSLQPQLTPGHDHVVKKCLAKDRNQRYSSARELLGDLVDLQQGRTPRSLAAAPAPAPAAPSAPAASPPRDWTPATPIPGPVKAAPQRPAPPAPPPERVAAPPPSDQTLAMPIPGLLKGTPQTPPRPAFSAPPRPSVPAQPFKPAVPPPITPAPPPGGVPLTGKTLPMRVPDLSSLSLQAPSSPQAPPTPSISADPTLMMDRTLPMQAPDLSAAPSQASSSPHGTPVPPAPPGSPLRERTAPMRVPDLSALSSQAPSWPHGTPVPPAQPDSPRMERTLPVQAADFYAPTEEVGPPALPPVQLPPEVAEPAVEPAGTSGAALPAAKSKLIPAIIGAVLVVLLIAAVGVYWKIHASRITPAPPPQVAVQTPPAIPPPVAAPVETPPPAPAEAAAPPPTAAAAVPKKTIARKPKKTTAAEAPAPPPAQPAPVVATPPPQPTPPPPSPEELAKAEAARLAKIPRIIQVLCNYGMKEATFIFSAGGKPLFEETLKGKKVKGGFLGIKGSYQGSFTHTITVPPGTSEVSVRVLAKDGATDLTKATNMPPPGGFVPTLAVDVDNEHVSLNWKSSSAAK